MALPVSDPMLRFRALQGPPDAQGCRRWQGGTKTTHDADDYPRFRIKDPKTGRWKSVIGTRWLLGEMLGRKVRRGYDADHSCNHRWCVEETHLCEVKILHNRSRGARMQARRYTCKSYDCVTRLWHRRRIARLVESGKAEPIELELIDCCIAMVCRDAGIPLRLPAPSD